MVLSTLDIPLELRTTTSLSFNCNPPPTIDLFSISNAESTINLRDVTTSEGSSKLKFSSYNPFTFLGFLSTFFANEMKLSSGGESLASFMALSTVSSIVLGVNAVALAIPIFFPIYDLTEINVLLCC